MRVLMKVLLAATVAGLAAAHRPHEHAMRGSQAFHAPHRHRHNGFVNEKEDQQEMRLLNNAAREQHGPANRQTRAHQDKQDPWDVQHEIERMAIRLEKLGVGNSTADMAQELDTVEAELARGSPANTRLEDEIATVRVKLCTERGFDVEETEQCEFFMRQACGMDVPKDAAGIGGRGAVTRPDCSHFFMAEKTHGSAGQAPAAAAAASPAGAVAAAAAAPYNGPPILGGKKLVPLPEQGVVGQTVQHADHVTSVDDWQKEFGPRSGHRSFQDVCKEHPGNHWCRLHGYDQQGMLPALHGRAAGPTTLAALLATALVYALS